MPRDDALAPLWELWLSHRSGGLPERLRQDLGMLPLPLLDEVLKFVSGFRAEGATWKAAGLRGDQIFTLLAPIETVMPDLFALLRDKIALAEKNKWLGGSLDPVIIANQTRYRKFAIVSAPRSGTHLLRSLLGSHPCIEMHGEAFNKFGQHLLPYLVEETRMEAITARHLFRPYYEYVEAVGFVLFRDLDDKWGDEDVWDHLAAIPDLKLIMLERNNQLERFASLQKSLKNHVWYAGKTSAALRPEPGIHVREEELRGFIAGNLENRRRFLARFKDHETIEITYEALLADMDGVAARLQAFLDVSPARLSAGTGKQAIHPIHHAVSNFDEITAIFAGTAYEQYV